MTHVSNSSQQPVSLEVVNEAIVAAYGSATEPHYGFSLRAFNRRPYQAIVDELSRDFILEDLTDLNYEVAFSYEVRGQEQHNLRLSLVGKFCVLYRSFSEIETSAKQLDTEEAKAILQLVERHGLTRLDPAMLQQRTCLEHRQGRTAVLMTVWEALFDYSEL
ncbi:hypothetical protein [Hymenobacter lapidiphilus]|uniref:Uncharacterized protein n=1 Tax=Hymenobacter lapidiphilus TaxID=2608003 RepID=A0A7Y7U7B6_9BACT|nr:hypothetical protein [Hymenobacter lapidiphilus]NVO32355.1 hypothetical protein [Hymenobacter lapidiphilus]